jgi:hypothetical protein
MDAHHPLGERVPLSFLSKETELYHHALFDVAGSDARRIERLDDPENSLYIVFVYLQLQSDLFKRRVQISVVIEAADDILADHKVRIDDSGAHESAEVVLKSKLGFEVSDRVKIVVWFAVERILARDLRFDVDALVGAEIGGETLGAIGTGGGVEALTSTGRVLLHDVEGGVF